MKRMIRVFFPLVFIVIGVLPVACGPSPRTRTAAVFDDIETYINDSPDSALAVLEKVDSSSIHGRILRARYSLLLTMALDKCYKDITLPGLLDEAGQWFSRHGSADEKLKTYYYAGRIQQDLGNLNGAAVAFSQAETYAVEAQDAHAKGLLFLAFGSLYNAVYNVQQELYYKQKGVSILENAGDPLAEAACGELALVYHSMQEWSTADSLYNKALAHTKTPESRAILLSNYARMLLLQPNPKAADAIRMLRQKTDISQTPMSLNEAGAYAYASLLSGDNKTADALSARLEKVQGDRRAEVLPSLSRIALFKKDFEKAFSYQMEASAFEKKDIRKALSDSVTQALQDYYDTEAEKERQKVKLITRYAILGGLVFIIVILLLILRKQNITIERDRLIEISDSLSKEMAVQKQSLSKMSLSLEEERVRSQEQSQVLDQQEKKLSEMAAKLLAVQNEYNRERLLRYRQLGKLGSTVWQRERHRIDDALAWKELKDNLTFIHQLQNGGIELIRRVDKELGGVVSAMRRDLKLKGKPQEVLFLCCCILDVDPVVISDALRISVNNVYKKRSRYRAIVAALGKEEYSLLLQKKRD